MLARIVFKTLGLSGILVGLFWAHSAYQADSFMLMVASMLIVTSVFTVIIADDIL